MFERLPVSVQTLYADLVDRSWSGAYAELVSAGGAPFTRTVKGREYWYLKGTMTSGVRAPDRYLGPDSAEMRKRISAVLNVRSLREDRLNMVRALRAARIQGPDPISGKVLSALSESGAFRLRAVVVGSTAFQIYGPMLGVRFENAIGQTGDVDIAQFHSVSVAVEDRIDGDLLGALQAVDPRFSAIPSPMDGRKTLRYALRVGDQETFSVDILCPLRGPDRGRTTHLTALSGDAQLLRYLDFLIYGEVNAVALHGLGVPINVPAPERFAVHKLIVAGLRSAMPRSQAKAGKDVRQAEALIEVLLADRPFDLEAALNEAYGRGASWRNKIDQGLARLAPPIRTKMQDLLADHSKNDADPSGTDLSEEPE